MSTNSNSVQKDIQHIYAHLVDAALIQLRTIIFPDFFIIKGKPDIVEFIFNNEKTMKNYLYLLRNRLPSKDEFINGSQESLEYIDNFHLIYTPNDNNGGNKELTENGISSDEEVADNMVRQLPPALQFAVCDSISKGLVKWYLETVKVGELGVDLQGRCGSVYRMFDKFRSYAYSIAMIEVLGPPYIKLSFIQRVDRFIKSLEVFRICSNFQVDPFIDVISLNRYKMYLVEFPELAPFLKQAMNEVRQDKKQKTENIWTGFSMVQIMLKLLPRQELNLNFESSITCSIVRTSDFIDPSGNPIHMPYRKSEHIKGPDPMNSLKIINKSLKKVDSSLKNHSSSVTMRKPDTLHPLPMMPSKPKKKQLGLRVEIPSPAQAQAQNPISVPANLPPVPLTNTNRLNDQKSATTTNNYNSNESNSDVRSHTIVRSSIVQPIGFTSLPNEDKYGSSNSLQIDSSSTMRNLQSPEAHSMALVPISKPSELRSETVHTHNSRTSSISSLDYLSGTQGSTYIPDNDRPRPDRYVPGRNPTVYNNDNYTLRSTYSPSSAHFPSRSSYSPSPEYSSARPAYARRESSVPPSPARYQYTPSPPPPPPPQQRTQLSHSTKSESPLIPPPQRKSTPSIPTESEIEYDYFKQDCIQCPYCCIIHPRKRHLMTCEPCGLVHPEGLHTSNLPSGVGYCSECLMAHPLGSAHPKLTGKSMNETMEIRNNFPAKKALLLMEKRRAGLAKTGKPKTEKSGKPGKPGKSGKGRGGKKAKAVRPSSKIRK
ncbi:unnamed protein product [Ambrosiozyma monospora]|uniref:Unnamed protein product n=1 Tax=Ambrosiozyma monospora TaxID=43982 RepID=A0A9W7DKW6_AMBMO|nr:unnamed protein product [Ambrosiozyma monospora]